MFIQIVQNHFRHFAALQLDDYAHARLVGLIAQIRDAFKLLLSYQFADADQQIGFVNLVRQLVYDNGLTAADLVDILKMAARAHDHAAAARAVTLAHALDAVNNSRSGKIRGGDNGD